MRKYEPAWITLKTKRSVRLAVPRSLHRRVHKAVIKEKDMDLAFKYLNAERGFREVMLCRSEGNILYLSLKREYILTAISVEHV